MPTYEYQCDACEHNFDEFQSITADPLKKCPECGKKKLRRVFGTGAAVIFKGSGFYQTDYRSDSYKKAANADAPPSSGDSSDKKGKSGTSDAAKSSESSKKSDSGKKSPKSDG